jgi:hypothetical protein
VREQTRVKTASLSVSAAAASLRQSTTSRMAPGLPQLQVEGHRDNRARWAACSAVHCSACASSWHASTVTTALAVTLSRKLARGRLAAGGRCRPSHGASGTRSS